MSCFSVTSTLIENDRLAVAADMSIVVNIFVNSITNYKLGLQTLEKLVELRTSIDDDMSQGLSFKVKKYTA